jgi:hypothetical protein
MPDTIATSLNVLLSSCDKLERSVQNTLRKKKVQSYPGCFNGVDGSHLMVEVQYKQLGPKFCNWGQRKPWPILVLNLCHVDRHVGCEEIWIGPQYKALRPNLTIPSNPID